MRRDRRKNVATMKGARYFLSPVFRAIERDGDMFFSSAEIQQAVVRCDKIMSLACACHRRPSGAHARIDYSHMHCATRKIFEMRGPQPLRHRDILSFDIMADVHDLCS